MKDIPAQPMLYPQIGGCFLHRIERIIDREKLPITLLRNPLSVTAHLIRTTNFLATVSTLSAELRNDGSARKLIPLTDMELDILFHLAYREENRKKAERLMTIA